MEVKGKKNRDLNDVMLENEAELEEYLGGIPPAGIEGAAQGKGIPLPIASHEWDAGLQAEIAMSRLSGRMEREFGYRLEGLVSLQGREFDVREELVMRLMDAPNGDWSALLPMYTRDGFAFRNTDKGLYQQVEGKWHRIGDTEPNRLAMREDEIAFSAVERVAVENEVVWRGDGDWLVSPTHAAEVRKQEGAWQSRKMDGGEWQNHKTKEEAQASVTQWGDNPIDRATAEKIQTALEGVRKCRR